MGRRLWDETVHSLCSRSPHGETVVARRAQLREDRLIPLFLGGEGEGDCSKCSHNARPQKALVGRAQSETPASLALVLEKGE